MNQRLFLKQPDSWRGSAGSAWTRFGQKYRRILHGCFLPHKKQRKLVGSGGLLDARKLYQLVATDLVAVETQLRGYTRSNIRPIGEIGEYLLDGGGKRIRPMLLLL